MGLSRELNRQAYLNSQRKIKLFGSKGALDMTLKEHRVGIFLMRIFIVFTQIVVYLFALGFIYIFLRILFG